MYGSVLDLPESLSERYTIRFTCTNLLYPTGGGASGVLVYLWNDSKKGAHDLELDCLAVDVNGANLKVDSYRAEVAFRVGVLGEPQEQARLNLEALIYQPHLWLARRTFPTPESPMRRSLKR